MPEQQQLPILFHPFYWIAVRVSETGFVGFRYKMGCLNHLTGRIEVLCD